MRTRFQKQIVLLLPGTLLLAAALSLSGADGRVYVIRDAKVHTLSAAGTLDRASVVIVDGLITEVGPSVRAPRGAQVIQGRGLEVYPGMINAWSNIGLTEIPSVDVTNDSNEMGSYKPQLMAFAAIHPASEHFPVARVDGVTTSISAPGGGIIPGQAALLHLDGWTVEEMAVLKSAGMVVDFPSLGGGRGFRGGGFGPAGRSRPFSELKREYEKNVKELAEWLEKARHYAKSVEANPAMTRDRELEALVPVVKGEMLVFLQADSARDIRNAVEFGKKEKLKFVIVGGRNAAEAADVLKKENVPVLLGSVYSMPAREDDPYDSAYTLPARLAQAGVRFALTSPSSANVRLLPYEAGMSVAYGLPREEALKAITVYPAEILGVSDKIGSIEKGKVADLVITDGDLLEIRTAIKNVFIAGRNISLESKHTRLYQEFMNRP
ncbi:MAG: amidohydrolase family protein [Acidobacteriota bacterium]